MERWYPPQERVNVSSAGGEGGDSIVVDDVTISSGPCSGGVVPPPGEGECE